MNNDGSGLGDQIFFDKIDDETREVFEASTQLFEDGNALAARVEQRQQDDAAALASDLNASLKLALVKLDSKRIKQGAWTRAEDIQLLEQARETERVRSVRRTALAPSPAARIPARMPARISTCIPTPAGIPAGIPACIPTCTSSPGMCLIWHVHAPA